MSGNVDGVSMVDDNHAALECSDTFA